MGAKAKYRRAMDKAIAAYGTELRKITALSDPERISTTAYRDATELVGDQLSASDRRALRQSDSLARKINNDEEYKTAIGKFNDRLSILQAQMDGQSTSRYYVLDDKKPTASGGFGNISLPGLLGSGKYDQNATYMTKEEALAAATKKAEEYNANQKPTGLISGVGGIFGGAKPAAATAEDFLGEATFGAATTAPGGDRSMRFGRLDAAAKDMQALAKTVKGTDAEQAAQVYGSLAEKLNARLTKISKQPQDTAGPLASPLAGELDTGVIK